MERLRNLLNSGVSLGELFATSTELRTTPKSTIDLSTGNFTLHQKEAIFLYQTEFSGLLIGLNQEAPFFMPKSARRRPKKFFSKAPQFWSKAPHFENFPVSMKLKMTPHAIFIAFLCDNFSQSNSKLQNKFKFYYFSKFFLQSGLKSTRPRKF